MRKQDYILILPLAALLTLVLALPAWAVPPLPSSFYGTVTVNGANVPDGMSVTAWINGVAYAQTATFTANGNSVYVIDVPGDDPETPGVKEGGVAGDTIVFKLGGVQQVDQTSIWQSGTNVELNLSASQGSAIDVSAPVDLVAPLDGEVSVPIAVASGFSGLTILSYQFTFTFNPDVLQFVDVVKANTLSANWIVSHNSSPGQVQIAAYGTTALAGNKALLDLRFSTSNDGGAQSYLKFADFKFNEGTPAVVTHDGSLIVGSLHIAGAITYAPNSNPVSDVTLSATGPSTGAVTSSANGGYQLAINAVGNYTVTPGKTGDHRDALSGLDAAYILQYVVGIRTFDDYQLTVADVSQFDGVTAYDAALIARYLTDLQDPPSLTGQWDFSPASRAYTPLQSDVASQNYATRLYGDVTGNWGDAAAQTRTTADGGPKLRLSETSAAPGEIVRVHLQLAGAEGVAIFAYELTLSFDPGVVALQNVAQAASVGNDWQLVFNAEDGQVSLVAFGASQLPTTGGDSVYFDFLVTGQEGEESALIVQRFRINEDQPGAPQEAAGKILVSIRGTSEGGAIYLPYINSTIGSGQRDD